MVKNDQNDSSDSQISVEVAFAGEKQQWLIPIGIEEGSSLKDAILKSHILERTCELDPNPLTLKNRVGIFGELKTLDTLLKEGDRVEIYRYLKIDPKEARRQRAKARSTPKRRPYRS